MRLEKSIEASLLRKARNKWPYMEILKMNGMGQRHWPDRMFVIPFMPPCIIELKTEKGRLTPGQRQKVNRLLAQGQDVHVCKTPEDALEILEQRVYEGLENAKQLGIADPWGKEAK